MRTCVPASSNGRKEVRIRQGGSELYDMRNELATGEFALYSQAPQAPQMLPAPLCLRVMLRRYPQEQMPPSARRSRRIVWFCVLFERSEFTQNPILAERAEHGGLLRGPSRSIACRCSGADPNRVIHEARMPQYNLRPPHRKRGCPSRAASCMIQITIILPILPVFSRPAQPQRRPRPAPILPVSPQPVQPQRRPLPAPQQLPFLQQP